MANHPNDDSNASDPAMAATNPKKSVEPADSRAVRTNGAESVPKVDLRQDMLLTGTSLSRSHTSLSDWLFFNF